MSDYTNFCWDDVKASNFLEVEGFFTFVVKEIKLGMSSDANGKVAKKMATLFYEVVEPTDYAGQKLSDRLTFGNDTDPRADNPETLKASIGAQNLKRLHEAAGIKGIKGDVEGALKAALQTRFVGQVKKSKSPDGRENFNVKGYYPVGSGAATLAPKSAAPAPKPIEATMTCGECGVSVLGSKYMTHVRTEHGVGGSEDGE